MRRLALTVIAFLSTTVVTLAQEPIDVGVLEDHPNVDLSAPLPLAVQQAIVASEDRWFFRDFPATSAISRGVARNLLLGNESSINRLARSASLGVAIANRFSHQDILTIFGQTVFLGQGCYGFADASEYRLGTALDDLTRQDALTLAAFIKAPNSLSNPDILARRYNHLVDEGLYVEFWDEAEAEGLKSVGPSPLSNQGCPAE